MGDHWTAQGDLYMTNMDNLETLPFDSESAVAALDVPKVGTAEWIPDPTKRDGLIASFFDATLVQKMQY